MERGFFDNALERFLAILEAQFGFFGMVGIAATLTYLAAGALVLALWRLIISARRRLFLRRYLITLLVAAG